MTLERILLPYLSNFCVARQSSLSLLTYKANKPLSSGVPDLVSLRAQHSKGWQLCFPPLCKILSEESWYLTSPPFVNQPEKDNQFPNGSLTCSWQKNKGRKGPKGKGSRKVKGEAGGGTSAEALRVEVWGTRS